jgi:hypothetical protein
MYYLMGCSKGCKKSVLWSVAAVEPAKEEEPTKEEDQQRKKSLQRKKNLQRRKNLHRRMSRIRLLRATEQRRQQ